MAHYVARVLKIRPNDILDGWGVAELVVAYGEYMNEDYAKNYNEWESVHGKKKQNKKPQKYAVDFKTREQLSEE